MALYQEEDVGNIVSLEHVNVQVSDQPTAILFYVVGMGFTRDPYLTVGLNNMWINVGEQQLHLPTRPAQVIDGAIGIVVPDLTALETRLKSVAEALEASRFAFARKLDHLEVTCPWGNRYRCYEPRPEFGDVVLGIPYVEFRVKPGSAASIVRFYQTVFRAPGTVDDSVANCVGRVQIGRFQSLVFRESEPPLAAYDGHHIAIYVANFSGPYEFLQSRGLVSEGVRDHQFRFQKIIDPSSGETLFLLEHEVRSLHHPLYQRPFVNRNPAQSQRAYQHGWDALVPFART